MKKYALLAAVAAIATLLVGSPASADNRACDSGFVKVIVHDFQSHWRAIACYKESTDNWEFQDTYSDGWSAEFTYPKDSLSGSYTARDSNGNNNAWIVKYSSYPENRWVIATLCSYDVSEGETHGCTTTTVYT